jgi:hypothetical protein
MARQLSKGERHMLGLVVEHGPEMTPVLCERADLSTGDDMLRELRRRELVRSWRARGMGNVLHWSATADGQREHADGVQRRAALATVEEALRPGLSASALAYVLRYARYRLGFWPEAPKPWGGAAGVWLRMRVNTTIDKCDCRSLRLWSNPGP